MSTRKTICFTGMDKAESEKLARLFAEANRRSGDAWVQVPELDADMLVIDIDSLHGHMTWIKVHNSGRIVVALSSTSKADVDHLLLRPINVEALAALLSSTAAGLAPPQSSPRAPTPGPRPAPATPAAPTAAAAPVTPAQAPTPPPAKAQAKAPPPVEDESVAEPVAETPAPAPAPAPSEPARDPMLGDYLLPGALPGPVKLTLGNATPLVLDPISRTYLGPSALKGFLPYATAVIRREDWTAITPLEFDRFKTEIGGVEPFSRLQWLAAFASGEGRIAPGFDVNQRYRLLKWPQTEREFPKHFRIATAMMKGPQLLTEIAQASTVPLSEVIDFVNACLAVGVAEMDAPSPSPDAASNAGKGGGLLGRLRGR